MIKAPTPDTISDFFISSASVCFSAGISILLPAATVIHPDLLIFEKDSSNEIETARCSTHRRVPHPCAAFCARVGFHGRRPLGIFSSHMTENQETSRLGVEYRMAGLRKTPMPF